MILMILTPVAVFCTAAGVIWELGVQLIKFAKSRGKGY